MADIEISSKEVREFQNVYSPSTILGVYANAIKSSADGRVILAKGQYVINQNQKDYSGYYYDTIKSPTDNKSLKAKVPVLLRSKLENNQIYLFRGYIEKRISFSTIELVFVIDDILQKEDNQISEEDLKRFTLLQKKIGKGYRDVEALIKEHIYNGTEIRIANLYGSTAIVHKDFEKGLADAIVRFKIQDFRCNFQSKAEIQAMLQHLNAVEVDAIALVRGGGDKASLEIFNDSDIGNAALALKPALISALGHTVDETLIDKIADKKFALPHDYGNSLKVWVDQAAEELAKSKSIFIEQVKKDLKKTFDDQILTLKTQLLTKNKEYEIAQAKNKEFLEQMQKEKNEAIIFKEKAFAAQVKGLNEQLQTKDQSLKAITLNMENSTRQQVAAATAEWRAKYEKLTSEKARGSGNENVLIYIIIGAVIGLIIGLAFK